MAAPGGSPSPSNSKKRWYIIAGVVVLVLVAAGIYAASRNHNADAARLYLTPENSGAAVGSTVELTLKENSGSTPVKSVRAVLTYDASKLQAVSATDTGSAFNSDNGSSQSDGRVTIARTAGSAVTGDHQIAKVTFHSLAGTGSTKVVFGSGSTVVRSQGSSTLTVTFGPATVHFAASPSPSNSPSSSPTPTATPHPATPAPTAKPGAAAGSIYLAPSTAQVTSNSNLSFEIRENSGSDPVNAVQANFSYPAGQFQFVSISGASSAFGLEVKGTGDNGNIVITRGTNPGTPAITGDHIVATVTLKAVGSGTAAVSPASGSALVRSTDSHNILSNITGGSYNLGQ